MPRDWLTGENMDPDGSREPWLAAFSLRDQHLADPFRVLDNT